MSSRSLLRGRCVLRPGGRLVVEVRVLRQPCRMPVSRLRAAQAGLCPEPRRAAVVVGACSWETRRR